jgi:hypothetical protein
MSRILRTSPRRIAASLCIATALFLGPGTSGSGTLLAFPLSLKFVTVKGAATNTITELVPINETTFQIKAQQVGELTHFGNFTGAFSYIATGTPQSIILIGEATLTNDQGEQLFLTALVVEVGADYPLTVTGTLFITGGTGRFANAAGTLTVTGMDEESPVDTFQLRGALLMPAWN